MGERVLLSETGLARYLCLEVVVRPYSNLRECGKFEKAQRETLFLGNLKELRPQEREIVSQT